MKGIYAVFEDVTERDVELIGKAREIFPYVTVAIQHTSNPIDDEKTDRAKAYLPVISKIRSSSIDSVGLAIDFFDKGEIGRFLERSGVAHLIVHRRSSIDLTQCVDFPKFFID